MLIREAMSVFWQTLKDSWEELLSLAVVNLVWLLSWGLPLGLLASISALYVVIPLSVIGVLLFPITTAGIYVVTNRVARGKTFHFSDFLDGIRRLWWRSLLWLLANVVIIYLIYTNIVFYPRVFEGSWTVLLGGFWLAVLFFWLSMQVYFWPVLLEQGEYKILTAWRNAALLILANPFYAFFIVSFNLVFAALCLVLTLPFVFAGMTMLGLLGNNAVLTLLYKLGKIDNPRPEPMG